MERKQRISVTSMVMDMLFPLACMVGGEQLAKKQKLSTTARKILLRQHVNNHWSEQGWKRVGFSDSTQSPTQPVNFVESFRKKADIRKDEKYFFMGSEILRITHVT